MVLLSEVLTLCVSAEMEINPEGRVASTYDRDVIRRHSGDGYYRLVSFTP